MGLQDSDLAGRTKARQQSPQMRTIHFTQRRELESYAGARFHVTHHGICPDLALLNEKMKCCRQVERLQAICFDKHSASAQIPDTANIFPAFATPVDPHTGIRLHTCATAFRTKGLLQHGPPLAL